MTTLPTISAMIETATNTFSVRWPERFAAVAMASTTTARPISTAVLEPSMPSSPARNGAAAKACAVISTTSVQTYAHPAAQPALRPARRWVHL